MRTALVRQGGPHLRPEDGDAAAALHKRHELATVCLHNLLRLYKVGHVATLVDSAAPVPRAGAVTGAARDDGHCHPRPLRSALDRDVSSLFHKSEDAWHYVPVRADICTRM